MTTSDILAGEPELVATGFKFTEGPVWHPDDVLFFSDIPAHRIFKLMPDGTSEVYREPSGGANGLTFDRQGRLIACEYHSRRVSRMEIDGTISTLADNYRGRRLNSPNDVVVKSDSSIYFTDPFYGFPAAQERELDFQGVYRIAADGTISLLVEDFGVPNGLAFSPDECILYIGRFKAPACPRLRRFIGRLPRQRAYLDRYDSRCARRRRWNEGRYDWKSLCHRRRRHMDYLSDR